MRKLLLAAMMASCTYAVHAETATWHFSYTGFMETKHYTEVSIGLDETTQVFRPDLTFTGSFTGWDDNGDGAIDASELTGFEFDRWQYIGCPPSPYGACAVHAFTYKTGGTLDASVAWSGHDEFYYSRTHEVNTGSAIVDVVTGYLNLTETRYAWTDQTRFSITPDTIPAPVPEPASGAMAGAGVLLLAAAARRRRFR